MKDNIDCEYAYKQNVYIHTGFYKGRYGMIKDYDVKTDKYTVDVKFSKDGKPEEIKCKTQDIRQVKTIKSLIGLR